ncbi:unnamed protein product [Phaeothamnion confervicola]
MAWLETAGQARISSCAICPSLRYAFRRTLGIDQPSAVPRCPSTSCWESPLTELHCRPRSNPEPTKGNHHTDMKDVRAPGGGSGGWLEDNEGGWRTFCSFLGPGPAHGPRHPPGHAASEAGKRNSHDRGTLDPARYTLMPFAMEDHGRLGLQARQLLKDGAAFGRGKGRRRHGNGGKGYVLDAGKGMYWMRQQLFAKPENAVSWQMEEVFNAGDGTAAGSGSNGS